MYIKRADGSVLLQCPLDRSGAPVAGAGGSWSALEAPSGELRIEVHSREGLLATGGTSAEYLWQLSQQVDVVELDPWPSAGAALMGGLDVDDGWGGMLGEGDEGLGALPAAVGVGGSGSGAGGSRGGGSSGAMGKVTVSAKVPLTAGTSQVSVGQLVLEVQRTRRVDADLELLQQQQQQQGGGGLELAFGGGGGGGGPEGGHRGLSSGLVGGGGGGAAEAGGEGMLRLSRNTAYDCLLAAALEVERCGPGKLTIEGPWQWLLTAFADMYGVSNPYRVLVHLQ